jgi:riboflavin synthase
MFTGIVEGVGRVTTVEDDGPDARRIRVETDLDGLEPGASISVDGTCLTVEERGDDWLDLFCSKETLDRTTLGILREGDGVNLERAMPADGRFDGHIVQGHVDGTATVEGVERVGEDWTYEFSIPEDLGDYLVEKGSITVDGISLTVADRTNEAFSVAIIPETYERTTLSEKDPGDPVNVEVDVVAKYVENMVGEGYQA